MEDVPALAADSYAYSTIIEVTRSAPSENQGLQACTQLKIRRVSRVVTRHFDAFIAPSGLKVTQYSLLSCLLEQGPARPVDITGLLNIDASTCTRVMSPMLKAGWIVVLPGPDARSHLVTVTPLGQQKRLEAHALWREAQQTLSDTVGAGFLDELHQMLDLTLEKFRERGTGPDSRG